MTVKGEATLFCKLLSDCRCRDDSGSPLDLDAGLQQCLELLQTISLRQAMVFVVGNGGSAAVASHLVNDLCNSGGVRAMTLHEPALLSCYSNDYGYEQAYGLLLERMAGSDDLLLAISSSGESANIINAANTMRKLGGRVVTFSGFGGENRLQRLGEINFWLDSAHFGSVEIGHLFLLHHLADRLSNSGVGDE
ncbi:MAG: SIS domain-containing protein [Gammaproteobacteria bacterium]|nr:SIS domain-containing protein [Gammaproteobacteria bacterium]